MTWGFASLHPWLLSIAPSALLAPCTTLLKMMFSGEGVCLPKRVAAPLSVGASTGSSVELLARFAYHDPVK